MRRRVEDVGYLPCYEAKYPLSLLKRLPPCKEVVEKR